MKPLTKLVTGVAAAAAGSYATYVAGTWLRYGHVKQSSDPLLDRFMPDYDVCDEHAIDVAAPADTTFQVARETPMDSSRVVRAIFRGRELIMRSRPDGPAVPPKGLLELTTSIGWGILASEPTAIAVGAVTKPWEANPQFRALPPDEFAAFREPGYVKIAWTLRAVPTGIGSRFSTTTRAVATDPQSREKFRLYWSFLSPGIHLIRRALLPAVKREAERRAHPLPGDDLLPSPRAVMTHAIDIDAPPREVWPWLVQMGCQRAGWYSWDALDNGRVRSADRIIPELQRIAVGDVLPFRPTGSEGFEVLRVEPGRALILGSSGQGFSGTWAFVLEPITGDRTRLVTSYRATFEPGVRMAAYVAGMRALHSIMERKQLHTIKHHAEYAYRP